MKVPPFSESSDSEKGQLTKKQQINKVNECAAGTPPPETEKMEHLGTPGKLPNPLDSLKKDIIPSSKNN